MQLRLFGPWGLHGNTTPSQLLSRLEVFGVLGLRAFRFLLGVQGCGNSVADIPEIQVSGSGCGIKAEDVFGGFKVPGLG